MDISNDIWGSLKLSAGTSTKTMLSSLSYRYLQGGGGNLIYRNNRAYKSVLVHTAKQMAMQALESETHKLYSRFQKYARDKQRESVLQAQKENYTQLIKNRDIQNSGWGQIVAEGNHSIIAKDQMGRKVPESLMIYYDAKTPITVEDYVYINGVGSDTPRTFETKTICFIDLAPRIDSSSSKSLVLTSVQGRDFTRKELISGGDFNFSVSGEINSNQEGVYPENDVKKFIQIMQYNGVINVHNFQFGQYGVKQILVKDYKLPAPEFKNVQPYSFTCVAVEPNEDVIITKDTIGTLNRQIQASELDGWYKVVLNNKLAETGANFAANAVSSLATAGLDALISNI